MSEEVIEEPQLPQLFESGHRWRQALDAVHSQVEDPQVPQEPQLMRQADGAQMVVAQVEAVEVMQAADSRRNLLQMVAVQIQQTEVDELVDGVWDLLEKVAAEVQLLDVVELQDALGKCGDRHVAEVEATLAIHRHLQSTLGHLECDFSTGRFT